MGAPPLWEGTSGITDPSPCHLCRHGHDHGRQGEGYFDERLGSPEAPTEMPTAVVAVLLQDSEAIEGAEAYHFVGHRPCSCL